jgi:hypothetical protein
MLRQFSSEAARESQSSLFIACPFSKLGEGRVDIVTHWVCSWSSTGTLVLGTNDRKVISPRKSTHAIKDRKQMFSIGRDFHHTAQRSRAEGFISIKKPGGETRGS